MFAMACFLFLFIIVPTAFSPAYQTDKVSSREVRVCARERVPAQFRGACVWAATSDFVERSMSI